MPLTIVEKQLEAYNSRNIDLFCSCFAEDIVVRYLGNHDPIMTGMEQFRARYNELFEKYPELHAKIINRMILGSTVIDQEEVTGTSSDLVEAIAIYTVEDNIIKEVTFVKP